MIFFMSTFSLGVFNLQYIISRILMKLVLVFQNFAEKIRLD